jgi:formylglycine-generating enzyme required for sulfatase activity
LEVTGGTYYRTYDLDSNGNAVLVPDGGPTGEADPATVSTLRLDKYEVTVGRFRQFVTAWSTGWLPAAGSGKHTHVNSGNGLNATGGGYEPGWGAPDDVWIAPTSANLASAPGQGGGGCDGPGTWTPSVGSNENLPINCENWYEAYAFCIWDGGFLPSEAEWEYAAAGGSQQREYPWGSTDPGTSNQYAIYGCYFPSGSVTCRSPTSIAPVGTAALGAGLWGQLDLAGNVFEWNLDGAASLLPLYVDPCTDCAYLISTGTRDRRGGSWVLWPPPTHDLVPSYPGGADPNGRDFGSGFRCARTP